MVSIIHAQVFIAIPILLFHCCLDFKTANKSRKRKNSANKGAYIVHVGPPRCSVTVSSGLKTKNKSKKMDNKAGYSEDVGESFRTPLSNISNVYNTEDGPALNLPNVKHKTKQVFQESNCNLFKEKFQHNFQENLYVHDDQIEESIIEGSSFSDDGLFDSDDDYEEYCSSQSFKGYVDNDSASESEDEDLMQSKLHGKKSRRSQHVIPEEYASLGSPSVHCTHCNARMWKEERVNKNVTKGTPLFSMCCKKGDVKLPPTHAPPSYLMQLYNDESKCADFQRNIRLYNSMFCFTSTGGNIDHSINEGRGPYIYRLNGQNHHVFGSLIPDDGDTPKFCQLYIYDTGNEVNNRLRWVNVADGQSVDADIVRGLIRMLDESNELVSEFRMARDRFEKNDLVDLKVELKICRSESGRENHISASDEVAGVMVGNTSNTTPDRDIIIEPKLGKLKRVSYIHPKLMALQYPLLFPNGEDGYHDKIPRTSADVTDLKDRDMISMKDYYSYRFQIRDSEAMTARMGGRLFQQYMVDAFSSIEQTRLYWFRINQTILRNELYSHICDSVRNGDSNTSNVGKGVILPVGFVGSKRYMQQNFQDALAVCRHVGHPDIFLTMTTNPLWDEIQKMMAFVPGCKTENCPDIISRVFRLKLEQLMTDIKKKSYFGTCIGGTHLNYI